MAEAAPRPSQVTLAGWLVIVGSVFVVLSAFDQVAGLHTMETREAVQEFLDGAGKGLGLDVQGALSAMRVLSMVAAACATAAAILGWQILQRSRSARLVLTVLALPLFLTGMVVGGFFPAVVAGAITMLWFQPARDWIDGKTPRPAPEPPARPVLPPAPPVSDVPPPDRTSTFGPSTDGEPRPVSGFGDRAGLLASLPPPQAAPLGALPTAGATTVPRSRPPALSWACVLTWVGAGLAAFVMLASIVILVADPDFMMDELYRQNPAFEDEGITVDDVRTTVLVVGTLLVLWSLAAIVVAAFAYARRPWARTALIVSASTATLLCVFGAISSPVMILPAAFCAVAMFLLLRPEVRAYFRSA